MTPQQLTVTLADMNLLPFRQVHLTRAGRLTVKGAALQAAVIGYRAQLPGPSPELDAAHDALLAAQNDMQTELDELAEIDEMSHGTLPNE